MLDLVKEGLDMWIRSQDKVRLIKINMIWLDNNNECIFGGTDYESSLLLGRYETKERSIEVIDEVEELLHRDGIHGNVVYHMPEK